ncbi:MAG: calcium/sodium antiporter [Eubacteriales bacterium]|nr:calcium/sodium antiporter [Eubacteriales bacterium]
MLLQLLLLVLGFVMLIKGADFFVDGASAIASGLGVSKLLIGLTIVAMGTSAPEAAVSLSAALSGSADLTIGNVVGSNIMNVLVILGLTATITPLVMEESTLRIELPFMIAVTGLLLLLGLDGTVSFTDGLVLAFFFLLYLGYLYYSAKKSNTSCQEEEKQPKLKMPKALLFMIGGLAVVVLGSKITVNAASAIALDLGMSQRLIGLTIIALGTSLPELVTSVTAARKGSADLAIGNIVGSNIFNILFVTGLTALITPVPFSAAFRPDMLIAFFAAVLLLICSVRKHSLRRWGGLLLIANYGLYFIGLL